jgi:hypothetical protein
MREGYDALQVCLNGHQITDVGNTQPETKQSHCASCGAKTICACPQCNSPMRGYRHIEGVISFSATPIPRYCIGCGAAFPWQTAALESLNELLAEGDLNQEQMAIAQTAIPDIVHDGPRTEVAAMRLGKILKGLQKPIYDVVVKIVTDVASETAKKIMGL